MFNLRETIVKSPFHKLSIDVKAKIELSMFLKENDKIIDNSTVYCISPYKTGTRYLNGCYRKMVSAHEPLHYLSLLELHKNFNDFFIRRLNTLNLKLECSGFLSAHIDDLINHPLARDLNYIIILSKPSSWITSAINHWHRQGKKGIRYHYTNLLFWKKKVDVNLDLLLSVPKEERVRGLEKISNFYFDFTRKTQYLKNVHYVKINEINEYLPVLDKLINEVSNPSKSRMFANNNKTFQYKNDDIDESYAKLVAELIQNNKQKLKVFQE